MPDRTLMPELGCAHRCFQTAPPYFLGSAVPEVKLLKRLLDVTKCALRNGYIIGILESIRVRLFQDRPKRNCRPSTQLLGLVGTACDRQQCIGQIVVDHGKIAREFGGDQAVGCRGSLISQNPPKHHPGIWWPVPWRCVEQCFKVHTRFLRIAFNHLISRARATHPLSLILSHAQRRYLPPSSAYTRSTKRKNCLIFQVDRQPKLLSSFPVGPHRSQPGHTVLGR